MKYSRKKNKFFVNVEDYYKFCKRDDITILKVTTTHNYKIKVEYVIIKRERS